MKARKLNKKERELWEILKTPPDDRTPLEKVLDEFEEVMSEAIRKEFDDEIIKDLTKVIK